MKAVKYFFILFLFSSATLSAQCPTVVASASTLCSSNPIQLNATPGYVNYVWSPAAGLSNPNIINPVANVSGNYTVTATTLGPNLFVNPDFAAGNTGFYCAQNYSTTYAPCNYHVGTLWFMINYGMLDHTPTSDNMFMSLDGCTSTTDIWEETVAITPNTNYAFSFWASRADQVQPIFEMHFIGNATGNTIVNTVNGIPYVGVFTWDQYGAPIWNSGANTSITVQVVNLQTNSYGNDFGLDDFFFQQICIDSDSVQITIAPPPNIGPDTTVCGSANFVLTGGTADAYLWNTGDTTQNITVSSSGQYYVTTTIGNCTFSDTANIIINPAPIVNLGNDTIVCGTVNMTLNAGNPGASYLWSTGAITQTINVNAPGTYFVTASSATCSDVDTIIITNTIPPSLGNDTAVCQGQPIALNGGNANSWSWNTGATSQFITPFTSGIYWVDATINGCTLRDSITVTIDPLPTVNLGNDTTICGLVNMTLNAGNPGANYLWSTGAITQTINVNAPGTYFVSVSNAPCSNVDTIIITNVNPISIGNDTTICQGQPLTLNGGNASAWLWNTGATTQTINPSAAGMYWVDATINGCTMRDSLGVTMNALPVVNLGNDTMLCIGANLNLDAGNPGATYLWNTGANSQTITVDSATTYQVTVIQNNCISSDNINVIISPQLNLGSDINLCGSLSTIIDAGNWGTSYLWNTGSTTQTLDISMAGQYWVEVQNGSCVTRDTVDVSGSPGEGIVFIPNSFTPNGNGLNEKFNVYGEGITSFHMQIFNRWGELVFETSDVNLGWDGTYKGKVVQVDTYVYVIDYEMDCGGTFTKKEIGHVNVIR